jgi:hypothetical protein
MTKKRTDNTPDYYGGDDPERINMCLTCKRTRCVNCLERVPNPEGRKKKRSYWAVERRKPGAKSRDGQ